MGDFGDVNGFDGMVGGMYRTVMDHVRVQGIGCCRRDARQFCLSSRSVLISHVVVLTLRSSSSGVSVYICACRCFVAASLMMRTGISHESCWVFEQNGQIAHGA